MALNHSNSSVTPERPNPDALVAQLQAEQKQAQRGKLRIYFGSNAGVGKTYAMLAAAQRERQAGRSVLVGLVEMIWTADQRRLPDFMPSQPIMVGDAFLAPKVFWGAVVAAVFIAAVLLLFRYWRGGVALRATASDQGAAYSVGINVPRVFSLAWVASAMLAAISGIIVGSIGGISSSMGVFGLSVLVVVIVGGLDSVLGALVAGLLIGLVEALAGAYLGGEYKLLATFIVLVCVLMLRPYGLYGTRDIERL